MGNNLENWDLIPDISRNFILYVLGPTHHPLQLLSKAIYLGRKLGKL
jgi:hypothetical protein